MLNWLLGKLGLIRQVSCSNPNVWTSLRRGGGKAMLFAMNLSTSEMKADVACLAPGGQMGTATRFVLPPMTVASAFVS